jgi:sec-independent protein translocase protein TatB
MFDIGFSEVLLIFVIALVVLGPEKLPRAASQVGRWVGRARAMARQFKEQLEEEVNLENVRKAHKEAAAKEEAASKGAGSGEGGVAGAGAAGAAAAGSEPSGSSGPGDAQQAGTHPQAGAQSGAASPTTSTEAAYSGYSGPDPADFRADTFSHAHPTNEYGANPLTANGGPPEEQNPPATAETSPVSPTPSATSESGTTVTPTLPTSEPLREPVPVTTTQADNHGHS